jgi:membrane protease YdiL (CAAX protease family)
VTAGARRGVPPGAHWVLIYGNLVLVAEAVLALVDVAIGAALHGAILLAVATHSAYSRVPLESQLPVLCLISLMRLLSIVMLVPGFLPIVWLVLVGAPALLGVLLAVRAMVGSPAGIGLGRPRSVIEQAAIASVGLPLGWIGVNLLGLPAFPADGVNPAVFVAVTALFVVLLEELLFRGLLQREASAYGAVAAVVAPNVFYAATYFSTAIGAAIVFMALTGILFSLAVHRTGSLWGVIGANLLLRIALQI